MNLFKKIFNRQKPKNPEDYFKVTVTKQFVKVEHPNKSSQQVFWSDIQEIYMLNSNEGPMLPDIWLALKGKEAFCLIPHGNKGCEEVYEIVSKYEGFNFENVIKSMACADNAMFPLWKRL